MAFRDIARIGALMAFTLLAACASMNRAPPAPIPQDQVVTLPDAESETMPAEFHGAAIGHDHLRGQLNSEN